MSAHICWILLATATAGQAEQAVRVELDAEALGLDALDDREMTALRQHLVFWLNKFDRVFSANQAMCLLYTGVDDGVPFPGEIDDVVTVWLRRHKKA